MLQLAKIADAKRLAGEIVALETQVAMAQWSKMANRDNVKTYNKKTRDELAQLAPGFDWNQYLDVLGAGAAKEFIVGQPSFFTAAAKLTDDVPLATWRAWLKWRVVQHYASVLNKELVDESFAFYGTTLHGIPRNRPRWKRAVETVQGSLGEAVGKLYVRRHFSPAAKGRMDTMVKNVIASYHQAFLNVAWMSPQTREKALAKLATFNPKIGYPKVLARLLRAADHSRRPGGRPASRTAFEWNRDLAKLGKPVDRDEWFMTPQTVNAYYNPSMNEIVFPAAILQPPFFNPRPTTPPTMAASAP